MGPRAICVASAASLVTSAVSASVSSAAIFEVEAIVPTAATAAIMIRASAVEVKAARAAAAKATATREPVATTNASFYACVVARAIVWLKLVQVLAAPAP